MSRPYSPRSSASSASFTRVNGKIRAREVRVIGVEGQQLGVFSLPDAINLARANGVDLVEIAAAAVPPVCRLVDFGKYRYEQAKREKEAKKHQHANKVKEVQLSPGIDPHDFNVKLSHAVDFLCDDMKVKITLKFRGREMAHQEYGFQIIEKFVQSVAPYGHPDAPAKLIGRGVNVMFSPLPRNKRAKHPDGEGRTRSEGNESTPHVETPEEAAEGRVVVRPPKSPAKAEAGAAPKSAAAFGNNAFAKLDLNSQPDEQKPA